MNTEMRSILARLETIYSGEPWYGRSVMDVFELTDETVVYQKPSPGSHSLLDLIYHMVTWQDFTLRRLLKVEELDPKLVDRLDWRDIDPEIHTLEKGILEFKDTFEGIRLFLQKAPDSLLDEVVDYREYDFRVLLNGLAEHNIYHIGAGGLYPEIIERVISPCM